MRVALIAPDALLDDRAFLRIHNRCAKDVMREVAVNHWKKRIPGHFKATARGKYGYKPREPIYKKIKMREHHSRTDLVASGRTRDSITKTQPEIRAGGRAANPDGTTGQLKLSLIMRLPFGKEAQDSIAKGIRSGRLQGGYISGQRQEGQKKPPSVTIADMKSEIGRILPGEAKEIAQEFARLGTKGRCDPKKRSSGLPIATELARASL